MWLRFQNGDFESFPIFSQLDTCRDPGRGQILTTTDVLPQNTNVTIAKRCVGYCTSSETARNYRLDGRSFKITFG